MCPPKLYQGQTINSWPSQPKAGYGLVMTMTTMTTMMTMMRVVRCNPSGNDSAQLIWESAQLISPPPADCQLSYSTFCCIEQNYKIKYINQNSTNLQIRCDRKDSCLICSSPKSLSRWLLMTIQNFLKNSRLRKIVYCKKRGGVCF